MSQRNSLYTLILVLLITPSLFGQNESMTLVVMDPLCDRLACDCVEGYAQRKYEVLAEHLQKRTGKKVDVFWGESLEAALEETDKTADIIVGKHSVVKHNARAASLNIRPVAALTGNDGSTMQTGLIVVRRDDPAVTVADLTGYRIFFGPEECDEKSAAPMALLREHGVPVPGQREVFGACSQAATQLVELEPSVKAAAVISSYAEPLLEGCGAIEKGDLRVIGISEEVPFVTAFVRQDLPESLQKAIAKSLLEVVDHGEVVKALETQLGFVPCPRQDPSAASTIKKK